MSGEDTPWIEGNLQFSERALAEVREHAVECYPEESCGYMLGPAADPKLITNTVRELNEANRYHDLDPKRFPRRADTYFKINEMKALRIFETSKAANTPVKVIYHSHCDAGAYFSQEDANTFAQGDALMWPVAFLVTSVVKGEVRDQKLWVFDSNTELKFIESKFEIVPM